uniref:acyltransferase family protein n=1 Tax=Candidatus Enterococcus willemsii TaxID=1857215 RepID=UPI00403FAEEE
MESKKRISWIDSLKGVSIIFIVLGHTLFPYSQYLFWFHVPIFFILSGLTLNLNVNLRQFEKKKFNSLLIPYTTFGFFVLTTYFFIELFQNKLSLKSILSLYAKLFYGGEMAKGVIGAYWFILVLFLSEILLYLLVKNLSKLLVPLILLVTYSGTYFIINYMNISIALPWNVLAVPLATIFIYIGMQFKDFFMKKNFIVLIGTFLFTVLLIMLNKNEYFNYYFRHSSVGSSA